MVQAVVETSCSLQHLIEQQLRSQHPHQSFTHTDRKVVGFSGKSTYTQVTNTHTVHPHTQFDFCHFCWHKSFQNLQHDTTQHEVHFLGRQCSAYYSKDPGIKKKNIRMVPIDKQLLIITALWTRSMTSSWIVNTCLTAQKQQRLQTSTVMQNRK